MEQSPATWAARIQDIRSWGQSYVVPSWAVYDYGNRSEPTKNYRGVSRYQANLILFQAINYACGVPEFLGRDCCSPPVWSSYDC